MLCVCYERLDCVFVYLVNFAHADYPPDLQCSRNAGNSTETSLMRHMTVASGGRRGDICFLICTFVPQHAPSEQHSSWRIKPTHHVGLAQLTACLQNIELAWETHSSDFLHSASVTMGPLHSEVIVKSWYLDFGPFAKQMIRLANTLNVS